MIGGNLPGGMPIVYRYSDIMGIRLLNKIRDHVRNNKINAFDLKRLWAATGYSCKGLRASFQQEAAFRLEVLMSVIILPAAWFLGQNGLERSLLMASWLLVPLVELLNSAIESVVDRVGSERHELSGRAKDQASAAVVMAVIITAVIWIAILQDKF